VDSQESLERVVEAVAGSPKYRAVAPEFVRRVAAQELARRSDWKEALKATKSKLHQVGGAYLESRPDYAVWQAELQKISGGGPLRTEDPELKALCQRFARQHASTRERLPILEEFYARTLSGLGKIASVLDLACGLNPLLAAWMPLAPGAVYHACDIYADLVGSVDFFLDRAGIPGKRFVCDLTQSVPEESVQLALVLKTLPCLEQVDKAITARVLHSIQARYLLVSFPAKSLGGRSKGMVENYGERFRTQLDPLGWRYEIFEFATELAFLVEKS